MSEFKPLIAKAADGRPLSVEEAKRAFDIMMSGEATPAQIGGFLMALRVRGEFLRPAPRLEDQQEWRRSAVPHRHSGGRLGGRRAAE